MFLIVASIGAGYAWYKKDIWTADMRVRVLSTRVQQPNQFGIIGDREAELRQRADQFIRAQRYLEEIIDEMGLYRDLYRKGMSTEEVVHRMRTRIYWQTHGEDEISFHFSDHERDVARRVTDELTHRFMKQWIGNDLQEHRIEHRSVSRRLDEVERELTQLEDEYRRFQEVNSELLEQLRRSKIGLSASPADTGPEEGGEARDLPAGTSREARRLRRRIRALEREERGLSSQAAARTSPAVDSLLEQQREAAQNLAAAKTRHRRLLTQVTREHPDVAASEAYIAQLKQRKRSIDQRLRQERRRLEDRGPPSKVVKLRSEIDELEAQLRRQILRERAAQRQGRGEEAAAERAEPEDQETTEPEGEVADERGERDPAAQPLGSVEEVEAAVERYETALEPLRDQYQSLVHTQLELAFQIDQLETDSIRFEVIDEARTRDQPESPTRRTVLIAAFPAAFAVGVAIMALLGFFDPRIYRPEDIDERGLEAPLLVVVPDSERLMQDIAEEQRSRIASRTDIEVEQEPPPGPPPEGMSPPQVASGSPEAESNRDVGPEPGKPTLPAHGPGAEPGPDRTSPEES